MGIVGLAVLTAAMSSGHVAISYPHYAHHTGLPAGALWYQARGLIQPWAFASITIVPIASLLLSGEGWSTVWMYPLLLAGSLCLAWALTVALGSWVQLVVFAGMPFSWLAALWSALR